MTQFNFKHLILFFLTITASCEVEVTDDINLVSSKPKLVIEGGLERNLTNPQTTQKIRLTTTRNFLDNDSEIPLIENAQVSITDGESIWDFTYTSNGFYENNTIEPEINKTYTLTIIWNEEEYEGIDTLTEVPRFDDFYFIFEEETLFTDEGYFIKFDTTDPAEVENYYYHKVFRNNEFVIVPDPGNSETLIVSDEFFDGKKRIAVNPNEEVVFEIGDIAKAQQLSISERYFDYLYEVFTQTSGGGLNLEGNPPPESIRGNLINKNNSNNRPLGFFYTVDVEENTITITE